MLKIKDGQIYEISGERYRVSQHGPLFVLCSLETGEPWDNRTFNNEELTQELYKCKFIYVE